jgi:cytochrome c553
MSNHKPESTSNTPITKSLAQRGLSYLLGLGAIVVVALPLLGSSSAQMDSKMPKGDAVKGGALFGSSCQGCHGQNGNSTNPNFPRLAGQLPAYLGTQLTILKLGVRPSPIMNSKAAKLSDDDIANVVAFLSSQKATKTFSSSDAKLAAEGKKLFLEGRPKDGVMACAICHGSSGEGYMSGGAPRIANQSPAYVVKIVAEFKNGPIAENSHYTAMKVAATPLTDADVKAVVEYLTSLE